jgi:hypothetical protein
MFDQNSANGILLFREASKILVAYGSRALQHPLPAGAEVYKVSESIFYRESRRAVMSCRDDDDDDVPRLPLVVPVDLLHLARE